MNKRATAAFRHDGVQLTMYEGGEFDLVVRADHGGEVVFDVTDRIIRPATVDGTVHEVMVWRRGGLVGLERKFKVIR